MMKVEYILGEGDQRRARSSILNVVTTGTDRRGDLAHVHSRHRRGWVFTDFIIRSQRSGIEYILLLHCLFKLYTRCQLCLQY